MKRTLTLLLFCAVLLGGCGGYYDGQVYATPEAKAVAVESARRAELKAAVITFDGVVNAITVLRSASAFTKSQGAVIDKAADGGVLLLRRWEAAINLKQPYDPPLEELARIMLELETMRLTGGGT